MSILVIAIFQGVIKYYHAITTVKWLATYTKGWEIKCDKKDDKTCMLFFTLEKKGETETVATKLEICTWT